MSRETSRRKSARHLPPPCRTKGKPCSWLVFPHPFSFFALMSVPARAWSLRVLGFTRYQIVDRDSAISTVRGMFEGDAAHRLAISRVRLDTTDAISWESTGMPPITKSGQTEHIGCMAVLGRMLWYCL